MDITSVPSVLSCQLYFWLYVLVTVTKVYILRSKLLADVVCYDDLD